MSVPVLATFIVIIVVLIIVVVALRDEKTEEVDLARRQGRLQGFSEGQKSVVCPACPDPLSGIGQACVEDADCAEGLVCVDDVCTTDKPLPPENLQAFLFGDQLEVTWDPPSSGQTPEFYNVFITGDDEFSLLGTTATSAIFTVTPGLNYTCEVFSGDEFAGSSDLAATESVIIANSCNSYSECTSGFCSNDYCRPCTVANDCNQGQVCTSGTCTDDFSCGMCGNGLVCEGTCTCPTPIVESVLAITPDPETATYHITLAPDNMTGVRFEIDYEYTGATGTVVRGGFLPSPSPLTQIDSNTWNYPATPRAGCFASWRYGCQSNCTATNYAVNIRMNIRARNACGVIGDYATFVGNLCEAVGGELQLTKL